MSSLFAMIEKQRGDAPLVRRLCGIERRLPQSVHQVRLGASPNQALRHLDAPFAGRFVQRGPAPVVPRVNLRTRGQQQLDRLDLPGAWRRRGGGSYPGDPGRPPLHRRPATTTFAGRHPAEGPPRRGSAPGPRWYRRYRPCLGFYSPRCLQSSLAVAPGLATGPSPVPIFVHIALTRRFAFRQIPDSRQDILSIDVPPHRPLELLICEHPITS